MFCCVIDPIGTEKLVCQVSNFRSQVEHPPIAGVASAEWTKLTIWSTTLKIWQNKQISGMSDKWIWRLLVRSDKKGKQPRAATYTQLYKAESQNNMYKQRREKSVCSSTYYMKKRVGHNDNTLCGQNHSTSVYSTGHITTRLLLLLLEAR